MPGVFVYLTYDFKFSAEILPEIGSAAVETPQNTVSEAQGHTTEIERPRIGGILNLTVFLGFFKQLRHQFRQRFLNLEGADLLVEIGDVQLRVHIDAEFQRVIKDRIEDKDNSLPVVIVGRLGENLFRKAGEDIRVKNRQEFILGTEIMIEGRLGDSAGIADIIDLDRIVSVFLKQAVARFQNAAAEFFFSIRIRHGIHFIII